MTAGKPRKPYLRADWKISLPAALAGEIDLMLEDPLTGRPKYGARARLVEGLLRDWLAKNRGEAGPPTAPSFTALKEGPTA